jgi:hypothetical protein
MGLSTLHRRLEATACSHAVGHDGVLADYLQRRTPQMSLADTMDMLAVIAR